MKTYFSLFILLLLLQSCSFFSLKEDDKEAIARVREDYLFKEDLKHILPQEYSVEDSIQLTRNYIDNWIKQQLLLSKAQINLESDIDQYENLVKKYRSDLYINAYKEAVVAEYLNTDIYQSDILTYYNNNKQNFKLNEELIKFKFISFDKSINNQKELIKLFKSSKQEDLDSLASKELSLKLYHLNDSIWIKYSDVLRTIPILDENGQNKMVKKGAFIEKEDSLSLYLIDVKDVLNRNDIAPLSYVTPTIKQMILHQRKLLLLRNLEETLYDDARKKRQFEIY